MRIFIRQWLVCALLLAAALAVGCSTSKTDRRLNGAWVEVEEGEKEGETGYRFQDGDFEALYKGVLMMKGTYTTEKGTLTLNPTHVHGNFFNSSLAEGGLRNLNVESKWFLPGEAMAALRPALSKIGLGKKAVDEIMEGFSDIENELMKIPPMTYTLDGEKLVTTSDSDGKKTVETYKKVAKSEDKASSGGSASGKSGKQLADGRDGKKYRTVKIGSQTWMAENLSIDTGSSWCYGGEESNCAKYGRLYDWNTAKAACPKGWHLPSNGEWSELVSVAGGDVGGKALKSTDGWKENSGTDEFGFSALPGGWMMSGQGFLWGGMQGTWWTASAMDFGGGVGIVTYRSIKYDKDRVDEDASPSLNVGLSVRCVKDR